jgi:hypothetical protein
MSSELLILRVDKTHHDLLREVSKNRGENMSTFVRRAVFSELARLSYLEESEKKTLGIEKAPKEN